MKKPIHPATAMCLFTSLILLIYYLGPISLAPAISCQGALFLLTHILLFITGSALAWVVFNRKRYSPQHLFINNHDESKLISVLLLIGISGGLLSLYNTMGNVQDVSLAAIATARTLKAQNLLHGGESHGGWLSAISFLTYPAGFAGLVAGTLQYEDISRFTKIALYLFIVTIFCFSVFLGGRSPILLLVLFIGLSFYTRTRQNKPWLPRSKALRLGAAFLLLSFMAYSTLIWHVRATESNPTTLMMHLAKLNVCPVITPITVGYPQCPAPINPIQSALQYAHDVGGATPKSWLLLTGTWLNNPTFTLSILNSVFYLTQHIQVTEKILAARHDISALYGSYHIDVIAAALRLFPQGSTFLKQNYETLMQAKVYGYFTGAWGALFIDFHYFSLLAALIWGFLAGMAWINFKNNPNVLTGIFYVFWNYSILISFASPPFGFSNSFVVFGWFLIFYLLSLLPFQKKGSKTS